MIIKNIFELLYVDSPKKWIGSTLDKNNFTPFYYVQCLKDGLDYWGTKAECLEWIDNYLGVDQWALLNTTLTSQRLTAKN